MLRIVLYIVIILFGMILSKKGYIHSSVEKRTAKFQTWALFFLLGTMGYKIGSDEKIISNFHTIGVESFFIALTTIIFSVACTYLIFKLIGKKGEEKC